MNRFDTSLRDIKPKDLLFVILFGVLISTLFGIAIGFVDYFIMDNINFSMFFILFFISSQYIGNTVRKQYDYPHIIYTVLTGIFLVVQALLALSIPYMLNFVSGINNVDLLFAPGFFFNSFYFIVTRLIFSLSFDGLLIIVILFVGTYLGVKRTY